MDTCHNIHGKGSIYLRPFAFAHDETGLRTLEGMQITWLDDEASWASNVVEKTMNAEKNCFLTRITWTFIIAGYTGKAGGLIGT
jgi:hypothetical protein